LRLEPPVAPRSEAEVAAEISRHYRWNFVVNLLDGMNFWMGLSFISSTTIVPLFISKLTPNPLFIGLAAMIAQGGWFLPQLFTANMLERLSRKKPVVVNLGFFTERLPMWVIVLSAPAALTSHSLALFLFLFGYAWHGLGAGAVATSWQELIARCFPVQRRGRFMGISLFLGAGAGALAALLSQRLLAVHPFPYDFLYLFLGAAVCITVSWFFLALTREPVQAAVAPRRSNRQFFADLPAIVRKDANYRRFLLARLAMVVGWMASGFVTVAAIQRLGVSDSRVGFYTAELLIGQTAANLLLGLLADRFGNKLVLQVGALTACLAFTLAWAAPSPAWYDPVYALMGVANGAGIVSGLLIVLEFAPPDRRTTYLGLTNTVLGVASMTSPLLGVILAGLSYRLLFAISAVANVVAFVILQRWVREPRKIQRPHGE
jgi:MFS family permease